MNQALLSKLENFGAQWCTKFAGRNGGQKKTLSPHLAGARNRAWKRAHGALHPQLKISPSPGPVSYLRGQIETLVFGWACEAEFHLFQSRQK